MYVSGATPNNNCVKHAVCVTDHERVWHTSPEVSTSWVYGCSMGNSLLRTWLRKIKTTTAQSIQALHVHYTRRSNDDTTPAWR